MSFGKPNIEHGRRPDFRTHHARGAPRIGQAAKRPGRNGAMGRWGR